MSFEDFMKEFNKELSEMIQSEKDQYFKDHGLDPSAPAEELGKKIYAEVLVDSTAGNLLREVLLLKKAKKFFCL